MEQNRNNIQKLLTEYSQVFTTQIAIQGQSSLLIANLTNIEHKPVIGDLIYGSDSYYAQITRVGESVVEFTVIGPITNLDTLYNLLDLKQDKLVAGDNITIIGNTISASGGGGGGGIPDAPSDGKLYGRKNNTWEDLTDTFYTQGEIDLMIGDIESLLGEI